jgi:hypothetical protein
MATVKKYNRYLTFDVPGVTSIISEGLLYGINGSGQAVPADRTGGSVIVAVGFCATPGGITAVQATNGIPVALCPMGIVDCAAADIAGGAFTVGATVFTDTAGKYTTTKPTTATHLVQEVGVAVSATKVLVNITPSAKLAQAAGNSNIGI